VFCGQAIRRLVKVCCADAYGQAVLTYSDGLGGELARQTIPYTDCPLDSIRLYACWDTEHWVIMLPSEY
jgi:hypothetical protein